MVRNNKQSYKLKKQKECLLSKTSVNLSMITPKKGPEKVKDQHKNVYGGNSHPSLGTKPIFAYINLQIIIYTHNILNEQKIQN